MKPMWKRLESSFETLEMLEAVLSAPIGVAFVDTDFRYVLVNDELAAINGLPVEGHLGRTVAEVVPALWPQLEPLYHRVLGGEAIRATEITGETSAQPGSLRHWLVSSSPVYSGDEIAGVGIIIDEVTEHKKRETRFLQARKMESIATMAGEITHDLKNILMVISGFGQLALTQMEKGDPNCENIQEILKAVDLATHLTLHLQLFSCKGQSQRLRENLNKVVGEIVELLHPIISDDILLTYLPHDSPLSVLADTNQLEKVLMNLATNARDAMPREGKFILQTGRTELNETFVAAQGYGKPGAYALLSVTDTGVGMDSRTIQHIFEPFFTTKAAGKGLGLAVAYGIIKHHEGFFDVSSEPGHGTTFRIYIPLITPDGEEGLDAGG